MVATVMAHAAAAGAATGARKAAAIIATPTLPAEGGDARCRFLSFFSFLYVLPREPRMEEGIKGAAKSQLRKR